jgi:hypothetical protein
MWEEMAPNASAPSEFLAMVDKTFKSNKKTPEKADYIMETIRDLIIASHKRKDHHLVLIKYGSLLVASGYTKDSLSEYIWRWTLMKVEVRLVKMQ